MSCNLTKPYACPSDSNINWIKIPPPESNLNWIKIVLPDSDTEPQIKIVITSSSVM